MKYFVPQPTSNSCGFACLKTLLALVNKDIKYKDIPYPEELNHSYSLKELIKIAKKYGLDLKGVELNDFSQIKNPFILLNKDNNHSIVVKPINSFLFKIYDPDNGVKIVTKFFIKKYFSNIALIFENHEIKDMDDSNVLNLNHIHFIRHCSYNGISIIISFIHILSFISAILCFYFINSNSYFVFPVIFMVASIILSIVSKNLMFDNLRKIDESILENHKNLKSCYKGLCIFKKHHFVNIINFISSVLIILFVFLIGATTQLDSLPVLITAFLVGMFEYLLLNKKDKLTISFINKNENEFLNNNNSDKKYLIDAIDKSYVFAKSLSFRKYLEIFILFSSCLLTSAFINFASLNYIIFYMFIGLFLLEHTRNLFEYQSNRLEYLKAIELINATNI